MSIVKEAVLLIFLVLLFTAGYFLMKKIDIIMDENLKNIEKEAEKTEPSYIVLTKELTDEEVATEIKQFRNKHGKSDIIIYSNLPANQNSDDFEIKK